MSGPVLAKPEEKGGAEQPAVPGPDTAGDRWWTVSKLATATTVAIPIPGFRVRDMLALRPGVIVESSWRGGREVPLSSGQVEFAWAEFEVADGILNARLTRLCGE